MPTTSYHHGQIIKEHRKLKKWTQAHLAAVWPRVDGDSGVNVRYVQDVEYGDKRINDPEILRKLSELLEIPLWRFGLSEYDPFHPSALPGHGLAMYKETLDVSDALIQQTLDMRRIAPLPQVERSARSLNQLFSYFLKHLAPPARLEPRFLSLYAQEQSVQGLMFFENKKYQEALQTFYRMYDAAKQAGDCTLIAHALQKIGVELKRLGRMQDAINALEEARDISFKTGKHVAVFTNAYLAHMYATSGDGLRFERAINTALSLAEPLKEHYGDGTDFIFQKFSGILILKSRGYLHVGQPEKTLALHEEVHQHIQNETNLWLDWKLYLYQARAYLALRDIEGCIAAGRECFQGVKDWMSPHRVKQATELLDEIDSSGYGNLPVVQEFRADLQRHQPI
ncbi:MAG TPA: helix-turn-helix transcriptional regulator [Ktedonobacteraceae bacterium]|nr:helix-turn-helix transcriptional regulator [Ktedonobacteraceae bacterium]